MKSHIRMFERRLPNDKLLEIRIRNGRILKEVGKLEKLKTEMKRLSLDVIEVSEVKMD